MHQNQMLLLNHGGGCCGTKHICGFFRAPNSPHLLSPEDTDELEVMAAGAQGRECGQNFYAGKCPAETPLERLDRYLTFLKENQPSGLVEIQLVGFQKSVWNKCLEERGFSVVCKYENSNTSNTIYVYHKIHLKGEK